MRFHPDGPAIPDILLERCDAGRVVFLCGAGVSLPSGMPNFIDLTRYVVEFFDPPADSEIMAAFWPWLEGQSAANVPLDQIFNLLHLEYGKNEVNALVTERLTAPLEINDVGREHGLIKRISSSQSGVPQIVTTNFDRLFEACQEGEHLVRHVPPAFPDLNFGSKIEGVTYLHGRLVEAASESHPYILSSADFGRAYLSEGWATNFIRHLLERYTVVLVGYQAEDPPIKYLLQGLNHDGQYDRSRLYAFDRGLPEEIEAKWRDRGVTAIAYSDHSDLWKSMEIWAVRADDPRRWRTSIIAKSQQDPKQQKRGQIYLRQKRGQIYLQKAGTDLFKIKMNLSSFFDCSQSRKPSLSRLLPRNLGRDWPKTFIRLRASVKSFAAVFRKVASKVLRSLLISAMQVAAFHAAGHQCSIGVFDDQIRLMASQFRLFFHQFLPAANRFVVFVSL